MSLQNIIISNKYGTRKLVEKEDGREAKEENRRKKIL